jgi:UDP-GlcNAc:undecaprenyl-phosphate/decaprenyl-phosphate GlcNAc-1-phosphate transferase
MHILIWLALVSIGLSLFFTPVFREVFRSCGFLDLPNQFRKIHSFPVPRAGGIAIAVSYITTFYLIQQTSGILDSHLSLVWKVLPAASIVFVVGLIDDLWGIKHWQKLIGQTIAAGVACWSGILVMDIVGVHGHAWWSIPATILWLLACTNAFNLVDGMDGLAAGVGLFATLTIFIAALLQRNEALAMATVTLAGCLLGFLYYNFNPATTFLGDSGSLLIGFVLGCYGIIWTQKSATLLGLTAPLMALSIPLADVTLAVARRFLRIQPIFAADRGHIHHRLLDRGMSPRRAVLLLYGLSSIVAVFSLLQSFSHSNRIASVIVLLFCALAWMGVQYLEYAEFSLAGRFLFRGDLQRTVKAQIELDAFSKALASVEDFSRLIALVRETAARFGFYVIEAEIAGERFRAPSKYQLARWTVRIPLAHNDFLELERDAGPIAVASSAGPFIEAIQAGLSARSQAYYARRRRKTLAFSA